MSAITCASPNGWGNAWARWASCWNGPASGPAPPRSGPSWSCSWSTARVGRRGTDGLVAWQGPAPAVDQEQLQLGAHRGRAGPETGPFQQLPQRAQAFPQPFGEAQVIVLVKLLLIDLGSHRLTLPA